MLTPIQKKLIKLKLSGKSDKEIAAAMKYTYGTIRNYFCHIYTELGIHSFHGVMTKIYEEGEKNFFENN